MPKKKKDGKKGWAAANAKHKKNGTGWVAANAKVKEETRARRAEQQALEGVPTASKEDVLKAYEAVTKKIDARLAEGKKKSPSGTVALIIYATSAGSPGFSVVQEGVNQFRPRGELADGRQGVPSIRILEKAHPHDVPPRDMNAHAGPGIEVADFKNDKILAETIEEMAQRHYGPILDGSDDVKIWIRDGAGSLKGIGSYKVCVRAVPLPLPAGWSIRTAEWKGVKHALKTDVCQGKTLKKLGATATPVAGSPKAKPRQKPRQPDIRQPRQPDIRQFFSKTD